MRELMTQLWSGKRDLALVGLMIGILMVLFTPIPSPFLDFLLVINITLALLILLATFFTETPLKFSTFPTILLLATLFRLALNVSATRLILEGGDAGRVINAIGSFMVGGNYIVGLVVFFILVVVQYVVVTNGAQRVAEVAARFTLDSMPGKQMAIDADMNMGLIDEHEARRRRAQIEKEASFYGAMDGATKFVKGDAIAGIIIILINITAGLAVGIAQLGMPWQEAVSRFTLLTIGDGIVTQIPSLVIAVATGIIITRAAADAQLGKEIPRQVFSDPRALMVVAAALLVLMLLPGFPALPVLLVLCGVVAIAVAAARKKGEGAATAEEEALAAPDAKPTDELQQLMRIEPIEVGMSPALATALLAAGSDFSERVAGLRKQFAQDYGFILPKVHLGTRAELKDGNYEIFVHGNRVGQGELQPDRVLAINPGGQRPKLEGDQTTDPAYGLPAQWIAKDNRQFARGAGYTLVDPDTVLMTHFSEVVKRYSPDLLTRAETERLVNRIREQHGALIDELVPNVLTYSEVQKVLQLLLREQVSVRNMESVLEVLVDAGKTVKSPEDLAERVRERLGYTICQKLSDSRGEMHVLTLAADVERTLLGNLRGSEGNGAMFGDIVQMDAFMKNMARQAEAMMGKSLQPVLLCPSPIRRPLRSLMHRSLPYVSVVGLNEVPSSAARAFGAVSMAAVKLSPTHMTDTIQAVSRSLSADIATLNTISHNIANSNTPGFRAERSISTFQQQVEGDPATQQQQLGQSSLAIDQKDGALSQTGRALDLALRGEGFFSVQRGEQTVLVRAGSFRRDTEGFLVDSAGDKVLGAGGPVTLDKDAMRIDTQGRIWDGEQQLGQLQLVAVEDPSRLQPVQGGFLYDGVTAEFKGTVQQGAVEHTNVDVAEESIRLMELTRHVESVQRAISIYDKAMDTGVNRLGEN